MIIGRAGPADDPVFADDEPIVPRLTERSTAREKDRNDTKSVKREKARSERGLAALSLAALVLSVVLLVAAAYTWNVARQMQALSAELKDLQKFEERIIDRLDRYNTGMQSMMESTNNRLSVLQGQIDDAIAHRQAQAADPAPSAKRIQAPPYSSSFFIPDENRFRPYDPDSTDEQRGFPGQLPPSDGEGSVTSVVGGSIQFRRAIAPDGSVKYERIR